MMIGGGGERPAAPGFGVRGMMKGGVAQQRAGQGPQRPSEWGVGGLCIMAGGAAQGLVVGTGGLRLPVAQTTNYLYSPPPPSSHTLSHLSASSRMTTLCRPGGSVTYRGAIQGQEEGRTRFQSPDEGPYRGSSRTRWQQQQQQQLPKPRNN